MAQQSCTTKDDDYPIIYRVLTIPGGWPWDSEPSIVFHQQKTKKIVCGSKFNAHLAGQVRHTRNDTMLPEHELRYTPEHELFFLFVWRSKITKRVWKLLRLFKPTSRESLTYFVSVRQFFLTRNIYICISSYYFYTYICSIYIAFLGRSTKVNKEKSLASHPPCCWPPNKTPIVWEPAPRRFDTRKSPWTLNSFQNNVALKRHRSLWALG